MSCSRSTQSGEPQQLNKHSNTTSCDENQYGLIDSAYWQLLTSLNALINRRVIKQDQGSHSQTLHHLRKTSSIAFPQEVEKEIARMTFVRNDRLGRRALHMHIARSPAVAVLKALSVPHRTECDRESSETLALRLYERICLGQAP